MMQSDGVPWGLSHIVLCILLTYLVAGMRWREAVFGILLFVLAIFPTLFLTKHTYYLHTYIPSFGVLYLVAAVVDNNLRSRWFRYRGARLALLGVTLVSMASVSYVMVRRNEAFKLMDETDMQQSFVLRRAAIAKNVYDSLVAQAPFDGKVTQVYLVYAREGGRDAAKWNNDNVIAATGWGSLPPLVYGVPTLQTVFKVTGDDVDPSVLSYSDIYFYDDFGTCFAVEPVDPD
jgi:hypothetical protein